MKLSEKTIKICKLTSPVLEKHSEIITLKLYNILFENYPETKVFLDGTPNDQQKKLASAIVSYANNLDNLEVLNKTVEGLAQKYVKTDVNPMVGTSLLQAIKDVFGDAATDEIIEALEEAYFFLGGILIVKEKELYISA